VAVLRDARKSALLRTRLIDDVDMIRTSGNDVLDTGGLRAGAIGIVLSRRRPEHARE
jgi:hypothetical protein